MQVELQPSPFPIFPSSHSSVIPSLLKGYPSPQLFVKVSGVAAVMGVEVSIFHPSSRVQVAEQPSLGVVLPSSHYSEVPKPSSKWIESPHKDNKNKEVKAINVNPYFSTFHILTNGKRFKKNYEDKNK